MQIFNKLHNNIFAGLRKELKNFITIFFLGIASGIPLALILSTLKANLVDNKINLTTIGVFTMLTLPYSLKFIVAPIIDSKGIFWLSRKIGHRKSWLVLTQVILAILTIKLGLVANAGNNLMLVFAVALCVGIASATQDIIIDGYRVELIKNESQGLATSFYIFGYRLGMLISGALALVVADLYNWVASYLLIATVMAVLVINSLMATETRAKWQENPNQNNLFDWVKSAIFAPLKDFCHKKYWLAIVFFIVCFKLADAFAGSLTLPFLMEMGYSKITLAKILKTFGLFATLSGVFCGGMLIKLIKTTNFGLSIAIILQMVSNFAFCYLANGNNNESVLYFVVFIENFCGGIGDAVFVSYLSSLCNRKFSATQYALFSSLASVSRSLFSSTAGVVAISFGWYYFFIFSAILAVPSLVLVPLANKFNQINQNQ